MAFPKRGKILRDVPGISTGQILNLYCYCLSSKYAAALQMMENGDFIVAIIAFKEVTLLTLFSCQLRVMKH